MYDRGAGQAPLLGAGWHLAAGLTCPEDKSAIEKALGIP